MLNIQQQVTNTFAGAFDACQQNNSKHNQHYITQHKLTNIHNNQTNILWRMWGWGIPRAGTLTSFRAVVLEVLRWISENRGDCRFPLSNNMSTEYCGVCGDVASAQNLCRQMSESWLVKFPFRILACENPEQSLEKETGHRGTANTRRPAKSTFKADLSAPVDGSLRLSLSPTPTVTLTLTRAPNPTPSPSLSLSSVSLSPSPSLPLPPSLSLPLCRSECT